MTWITPFETLTSRDSDAIGGKGASLGRLRANRLNIPRTLCVTTQAYRDFVDSAGLREKIHLEINRKIFSQMRWEEIWDTSQRIRLLFLRSPMPPGMASAISRSISQTFGDSALVVRSSAPDEDHSGHSFAGLHASYTHRRGAADVIRHLRLVWASLWSDAALLYRQELGLDSATSTMAVLIQEMVPGQVSGIYFTQNPNQADHGIIEAVHGMNPPLVDGKISPDRWILDVGTGEIIDHTAPESRSQWQPPMAEGADDGLVPLPEKLRHRPPLQPVQIATLWEAGTRISTLTGIPHDIEWTFRGEDLVLLQARPITASSQPADGDQRAWYLSLHRSLDNLLDLRRRIEKVLIPQMRAAADQLAAIAPGDLTDADLSAEIRRRWEVNQHWVSVYWEDFIPFAHGMRLFGQVYNEIMAPEDPYEFMVLLKDQDLISIRRNRSLADLAAGVRRRPERGLPLKQNNLDALDEAFRQQLEAFIERYGDLSCPVTGAVDCAPDVGTLANVVLEMAKQQTVSSNPQGHASPENLKADFLNACASTSVQDCRQLLSLARSSYRLRDDDNIILGAIEARLIMAVQEGRRRVALGSSVVAEVLSELGLNAEAAMTPPKETQPPPVLRDRQITGQPAGPGLARGKARVIHEHIDIAGFKRGEIIVCDGVDPNMTFVMPLAAGIVERRGGMLIHGAIIAREYGLPCVTGVADATTRIRTGQRITVDGYLGIVTLGDDPPAAESTEIADHTVVGDKGPIASP
jgi:phosphohistidine swiveling domain-containing protein